MRQGFAVLVFRNRHDGKIEPGATLCPEAFAPIRFYPEHEGCKVRTRVEMVR